MATMTMNRRELLATAAGLAATAALPAIPAAAPGVVVAAPTRNAVALHIVRGTLTVRHIACGKPIMEVDAMPEESNCQLRFGETVLFNGRLIPPGTTLLFGTKE